MPYPIIIAGDAPIADTFIGGDHEFGRLLRGGIIRPATPEDRERIAALKRISYPRSGASWGDGDYLLANGGGGLYVLDHGFNHGHLELARRRMIEEATEAKRRDLYDRLESAG